MKEEIPPKALLATVNCQAVGERILVLSDSDPNITPSGIVVVSAERPSTGTVLSCGNGYRAGDDLSGFDDPKIPYSKWPVHKGCRIVYNKGAGTEINVLINGEPTRVLAIWERDVIAIFEDDQLLLPLSHAAKSNPTE